jgi:hypothetical protein
MQDYAEVKPGRVMSLVEYDGRIYIVTETGVFRNDTNGKFYEVEFMTKIKT